MFWSNNDFPGKLCLKTFHSVFVGMLSFSDVIKLTEMIDIYSSDNSTVWPTLTFIVSTRTVRVHHIWILNHSLYAVRTALTLRTCAHHTRVFTLATNIEEPVRFLSLNACLNIARIRLEYRKSINQKNYWLIGNAYFDHFIDNQRASADSAYVWKGI